MEELVIYEKPTCSKCRAAVALADASGRPARRIRYHEERLSKEKLNELVRKLGMRPAELVRTKEPLYRALGVDVSSMTDDAVLELLADQPDLLERPILEYGDRAVLGRPVENVGVFLREIAALNP